MQALAQADLFGPGSQFASGDRAMIEGLQVVGYHLAGSQLSELQRFVDAHDDFAADVQLCTAGRDHRDLRLVLEDEISHRVGQHGIACQVQAGFARHLQEIADTVFHEPADQAQAMGTAHRGDRTAQPPFGLARHGGQWLDVQTLACQVACIVWGAYHRDAALTQPFGTRPVQMVEVASLAVGDQAVRHRVQQRRGLTGQVDHGVSAAVAEEPQGWVREPLPQHGVDEDSMTGQLTHEGGISDLVDFHHDPANVL